MKYHLLERAVDFAFDIHLVGDIKEHCSHKWMIFIHCLMCGKYPSKNSIGYDKKIASLSGPPHLMVSFLKNNYRAKRLYGASVHGACQGLHRLMTSGVVLQWYMEYSKKHDVDDHIRSGDLCHMLSTRGVLKPTEEGQPQFNSAAVPVHTLANAEAGITAVIRSGMSVALAPPTNQEYREYFNSHIAALTSSALEREVLQFRNINPYITDFSTSSCLFPAALRPIVDMAVVSKTDCIRLEGQRMVKIVADALTQKASVPS
jgi:hypothetical protein